MYRCTYTHIYMRYVRVCTYVYIYIFQASQDLSRYDTFMCMSIKASGGYAYTDVDIGVRVQCLAGFSLRVRV